MTPFSSVAMLEKFALLKMAFCKAPVLSRAASRRTSVTASALPASPSRKAESWICSDMAASVQIVKLKNSITPRTSPPRRIGKCIGNSNAIFSMTTVGETITAIRKLFVTPSGEDNAGASRQFHSLDTPQHRIGFLQVTDFGDRRSNASLSHQLNRLGQ